MTHQIWPSESHQALAQQLQHRAVCVCDVEQVAQLEHKLGGFN